MITLTKKGSYRLVSTKDGEQMLYLGKQGYLWSHVKGIGEQLSFTKDAHELSYVLREGDYEIYDIKDEQKYMDLKHLQLLSKPGTWQGYLLLTGLPTTSKINSRIIPTSEVIALSR